MFQKLCYFFILTLLLSVSCRKKQESLPYFNTPDFTPNFGKEATHQIGDFSFKDETNATFTQKNIDGKIHLASFIFTSCGSICPIMVENIKTVNDRFQNDSTIIFLSFSVTPWLDTPQRLSDFKRSKEIKSSNWHFLTGTTSEIYQLARKSYFAEEDLGYTKDSSDFLHTEHILLIDRNRHIRGIYNGTLQTDMIQLTDDIGMLKKE